MAVGVGADVGIEKKEKEEGGSDANVDADAHVDTDADLLGIGLKPRRTDLGLLLTHQRLAERKVINTTLP